MPLFLPPAVRGMLTFAWYVVFTVVLSCFLFAVAAVKFLVPAASARAVNSRVIDWIASGLWVACSVWAHRLMTPTRWDIRGADDLHMDRWCMIVSNHQSWVDILVLIRVLRGKVPPYKFFIKKQLLWLPFMGQCFWALDFPIMKRYSKEFLEKHPHLKGSDLEATRRSCEKFKDKPVTIMNFIEGTRFTPEKHQNQNSPYRRLLRPRAGGAAMTLYAMGDRLEYLVDVTIAYPGGVPALWTYFCGRAPEVRVAVKVSRIPPELKTGRYFTDPQSRRRFHDWLHELWTAKDRTLDDLMAENQKAQH